MDQLHEWFEIIRRMEAVKGAEKEKILKELAESVHIAKVGRQYSRHALLAALLEHLVSNP